VRCYGGALGNLIPAAKQPGGGGRVYGLQDEGTSQSDFSCYCGRIDSITCHRTDSYICVIRETIVVFGSRCSDLWLSGGRELSEIDPLGNAVVNTRTPHAYRTFQKRFICREGSR
jgi:hypothetical protein